MIGAHPSFVQGKRVWSVEEAAVDRADIARQAEGRDPSKADSAR